MLMVLLMLLLLPLVGALNMSSSNYTGTTTNAPTATSITTLTTIASSVSQATVTGQPSIYGQISVSGILTVTPVASFCYETRSYSNYVTPSPIQGPAIVPAYQPMQEQQSFIIGVSIGGAIIVFIVVIMIMEILQNTKKKVLTTTNPMAIQTDYVIENNRKYYYDKPNGRLLAEGWKRFQDGNDVWYSNGLSSSWLPVYRLSKNG